MPIDLKHNWSHANQWILLCPGAYEFALQRVCAELVRDGYAVLRCADAEQLAELWRCEARRAAALARRRRGEPLHCMSHHLPEDVTRRFPCGHHPFVVTPEDRVRLKPQAAERP